MGGGIADLRSQLAACTITLDEAVWLFLDSRRGEAYCTQCLANALGVTRRIDRALMAVEGRGAYRHHGPCMVCGKDRLLTGLR